MICLYSKTNTNYNTNGDAVLNPISAQLQLTLNGAWVLTLSHPYDQEEKWKLLEEGATIQAPITCIRELSTTLQRFKIYQRQKNMHDVSVIAFPEGMEATFDTPVDNLVITNKTAAQTIDLLQPFCNNKYTLYTNLTTNGSTSWANTNIFSAIAGSSDNTFLKTWGGELIFDNKTFKILSRVGDTTAANHKITYGHNLSAIDYDKDDSGVTTRIYPISQDGIRLNGTGYVDSPNHFSDYPVAHCRHMIAPYYLVDTNPGNNTATAIATQQATAAIATQAETLGRSSYATAISGGFQPEYIKQQRDAIIAAVKAQALSGVVSASMYAAFEKAIESGLSFLASVQQPAWGWMGSEEQGWKYGDANGYATNQYIRISRKWSYFGADGNWQEPRDDSEEWDWYQGSSGTGKKYGNFKKYYAHNEFVYITEDNQMKEYWFNEQGWYESDESGDSDWDWHGSGTAEDPWWFGEEGASAGDTRKYAHDCWLFIDGTLYFFDSYGYYDGSTKFEYYQWDWVEDDERWWFGNAIDKTYAATYLTSQWAKINGDWYYFDANGYAEQTNASIARVVAVFTNGMTGLTSTITTNKSTLYTLLYNQMSAWALKQYTQGIDLPVITITVNMVDLSKTQDYQGFADLETVKLGDSVAVTDAEHGISTTNRVIGLTYDLINDYNAEVIIGSATASVASMISGAAGQAVAGGFDSSAIETQLNTQATSIAQLRQNKQDKLNAGNLINLSGSTISADIEANPGAAGTTDLQKIRLGNTIFNLPSGGGGLQYWTETEKTLYNIGQIEGTSADAAYKKTQNHEVGHWQNGNGWTRCMVTRISTSTAPIVAGHTSNAHPMIIVASLEPIDFEWGWSDWTMNPPYGVSEWGTADTYPLYAGGYENYFGYAKETVTYNGATWYILAIDTYWWAGGTAIAGVPVFAFNYYDAEDPKAGDAGLALLAAAHASDKIPVTIKIATEGDILKYYTDEKIIIDIDEDGNVTVNEITTAAGSLTNQMAAKQNLLAAGDNITINGNTISATDTKYNDFTGATAQEAGRAGLVPAPETTEIDKFLKGDGTWADIPTGTEVEANPTGTATDTLNKIQIENTIYNLPSGGGGGGLEAVELTQAEYNALTPAEKTNGKLYLTHDGGYSFVHYNNDIITIRVNNTTGQTLWFFNGFYKDAADLAIPAELVDYLPDHTTPTQVIQAKAWTDDTSSTTNGWIGFVYPGTGSVKIRSWSINFATLVAGTFWAVLDIDGSSAEGGQTLPYSTPTEGLSLLPNRIYYNNTLYADNATGGGGGDDPGDEIIIFKETLQNQNKCGITLYNAAVSNGVIKCNGENAGFNVTLINIDNIFSYSLIIKVSSSGFSYQAGRSNTTADLNGIINQGAGRLSYNNDSLPSGEFYINITTAGATEGVFLGGGYQVGSVTYDITEIKLKKNATKYYS